MLQEGAKPGCLVLENGGKSGCCIVTCSLECAGVLLMQGYDDWRRWRCSVPRCDGKFGGVAECNVKAERREIVEDLTVCLQSFMIGIEV